MGVEILDSVHYYPKVATEGPALRRRAIPPGPIALYVHIPFCDRRCYFCEFAVVAGQRRNDMLVEEYLSALKAEMACFREQLRGPQVSIETIQIGGGTPTYLTANALEALLNFIFEQFDCGRVKEIIVEGFPSSITDEKLAVFESFASLKLNIGVQTFQDEILGSVGRSHDASDATRAINAATASRIPTVGADIIFGLPESSVGTVVSDLERLDEAGVEHVALYPLWIYDRTALRSLLGKGRLEAPMAALQKEQLAAGSELLRARGFERYSAFHYTKGQADRHLYGLWQMLGRNWIGFGMSAMSHIDGEIFFNERNIRTYIQTIGGGAGNVSIGSRMSLDERMTFAFLYGLRLREAPNAAFADRFGRDFGEVFASKIEVMRANGWVEPTDGSIALTLDGILALGEIEEFMRDRTAPGLPPIA